MAIELDLEYNSKDALSIDAVVGDGCGMKMRFPTRGVCLH
jgi:hypothetical protein